MSYEEKQLQRWRGVLDRQGGMGQGVDGRKERGGRRVACHSCKGWLRLHDYDTLVSETERCKGGRKTGEIEEKGVSGKEEGKRGERQKEIEHKGGYYIFAPALLVSCELFLKMVSIG